MITIHAAIVMIVSPVIVRFPSAKTTGGIGTTEVNDLVFAPKINSAIFWSR